MARRGAVAEAPVSSNFSQGFARLQGGTTDADRDVAVGWRQTCRIGRVGHDSACSQKGVGGDAILDNLDLRLVLAPDVDAVLTLEGSVYESVVGFLAEGAQDVVEHVP